MVAKRLNREESEKFAELRKPFTKAPAARTEQQRHLTVGVGNGSKNRIWHISTFARARFPHVYGDIYC